ncbi:hypothetical protein AVEN_90637-1 [Araneus ventricosus]|uniref:Uncharacterized protein n=1 Tax=Araneus ventricosus TaxID=182803 RepID=A0A4Y2QAG6_ARAVE|nr:hypothetical protein AVEN_90637-1 [Araneus ventricosus]
MAECPPVGVARKFGEGVPVPVPSSSSDRSSKLRGPSLNSPRLASKWDVNLTHWEVRLVYLYGRVPFPYLKCSLKWEWSSGNVSAPGPEDSGSKPDSTEVPTCTWAGCTLNLNRGSNVLQLVWCGSLEERGWQPRRHFRRLSAVQNDELVMLGYVELGNNGFHPGCALSQYYVKRHFRPMRALTTSYCLLRSGLTVEGFLDFPSRETQIWISSP